MLYEFNNKIYVKPFSNKIVEVEITKNANEYNAKATNKVIFLTRKIQEQLIEITLEDAYKKTHKNERNIINTI